MPRRRQPRSELRSQRTFLPELGAKHSLVMSDDVESFYTELDIAWEELIPDATHSDSKKRTRARRLYRLFDDPDRMAVTVMERRLPRRQAERQNIRWNRNDVGRIEGEIQNELARLALRFPTPVTFTDVVRLGDADEMNQGRKIALLVDPKDPVAEALVREHEVVVNGIQGSLRRFRYPYAAYVPHLTVGRIFQEVPEQSVGKAVGELETMLPFTAELAPIEFSANQRV